MQGEWYNFRIILEKSHNFCNSVNVIKICKIDQTTFSKSLFYMNNVSYGRKNNALQLKLSKIMLIGSCKYRHISSAYQIRDFLERSHDL